MPTDSRGSSLPAPPRAVRRRALSPAAMTVFSFLGGALVGPSRSAVTPLYQLYQQSMHLTPLMITLVFAVYAISLLATLLTVGGLSDYVGGRPVILLEAPRAFRADLGRASPSIRSSLSFRQGQRGLGAFSPRKQGDFQEKQGGEL